MAKSPIKTKAQKNKFKGTILADNVEQLVLTMPTQHHPSHPLKHVDISYLTHLKCNKNNERIVSRVPYIKALSKAMHRAVTNGSSSPITIYSNFQVLLAYISFCDEMSLDPFSNSSYLAYVGNMGELRHRVNQYSPSKKRHEYSNGEEVGITESSARQSVVMLTKVLNMCGFDVTELNDQCKPFSGEIVPHKPYSEQEEKMIIDRISDLFFSLAPQLIALKEGENTSISDELLVPLEIDGEIEPLWFSTSLASQRGRFGSETIRYDSAFNICMTAAYHLFCYFTSLNDSPIWQIGQSIQVEEDNRDKSLKTIKVSAFKARANKEVSAHFSNEMDEPEKVTLDVDKRDGVNFITLLHDLSVAYAESDTLIYFLNTHGEVAKKPNIVAKTKCLIKSLNLTVLSKRTLIDWFEEHWKLLRNESIALCVSFQTTPLGRIFAHHDEKKFNLQSAGNRLVKLAFLCLTAFAETPVKGAVLPLHYSESDEDGNVTVTFGRVRVDAGGELNDLTQGRLRVPETYLELIQDIEDWAESRAAKNARKHPRYLLRMGAKNAPRQWEGLSPVVPKFITELGVEHGDYFVDLTSSRFRKTTSNQEYSEGYVAHVRNILQNQLKTIDKAYANGHPELNDLIISQALQVLERVSKGECLERAKKSVLERLKIPMLAHDEWIKGKIVSNPNGLICNGEQSLIGGKKTQRETNRSLGMKLPCSEFDSCHLCQSAKGIDEPNAVYKLISFIDVLHEALDRHPNAKMEVQEKIAAFEYVFNGASSNVLVQAQERFNNEGRHPRVSFEHATLSINSGGLL